MSRSSKETTKSEKILLLMSGSIACAKASALISAWVKQGHEVRVACTRSVSEFLGHATIEGFSGHPVLDDAFATGQVMDHIHMARWADLIVAAPATSNLINKLAAGIADDVVTTLWQAGYGQGKPMYIVPAMNTHMWNYPATQESIQKLKSWGIEILPTAHGDLACGEFGAGRMLEPEEILDRISTQTNSINESTGKRILITAGGTREPIDSVRYIGNRSSGRTSAALTDALVARGHQVCWLGAQSAVRPLHATQTETFVSFDDLANQLQNLLGTQPFDVVIHAAAVSDFSVERIEQNGLSTETAKNKLSTSDSMSLHLKANPKLLDQLRNWSVSPDTWVIGFKLTHNSNHQQRTEAIMRLFDQPGVNAVVHNDLNDIEPGQHGFTLHTSSKNSVPCVDSGELASQIDRLINVQAGL
jgi:phosphopantothenoylcysteine decarboxylase/phosphopantothenate--cysteine ligase